MSETDEGIGGRKWSFQRLDGERLALCEGTKILAELTETCTKDRGLVTLLVTAPQLWEAANEVVKIQRATNLSQHIGAQSLEAFASLANMVAKAVGKDDWKDVAQ